MGSVMESDGQLECHGGRHREKPWEKRTADPKTLTQKREDVFRVTVIVLLLSWDAGCWKGGDVRGGHDST